MDKYKYAANKYFIYSIQEFFANQYLKIENRKMQSIRQLLNDFIELEKNIMLSVSDKEKLRHTRKALLSSILFYLNNSPLKLNILFKNDLELIKDIISNVINTKEQADKDSYKNEKIIFNCISSLNKKINNSNILNILIDIQLSQMFAFEEVDILLEYYISELLYEGYSLDYLNNWYKDKINFKETNTSDDEQEVEKQIVLFKELSNHKEREYGIILSINLPENLKEEVNINKKLNINDIQYQKLDEENIPQEKEFKTNKKSVYLKALVQSCDDTSAVTTAINTIENYLQVYKVIDTSIGTKAIKGCAIEFEGETRVINLKNDPKYSKEPNYREIEDIQEFIELREHFRSTNNKSNSIRDMERVINIVQKLPEDTIENQLLNAWGALENIVRLYEANSIIEKINSIIPKVIVMYSVKRETNHLWDRILPLINKGKLEVDGIEECKSTDHPKKYNKEKFATFLLREKTGSNLYKKTQVNISINRSVAELNKLLKDPKQLKNKIIFEEEGIRHNINTIYRLRNNLVHNGGNISINVENNILILKYYINCILGTLIHHIKRNPELNIEEVLNSIVLTYENYIKGIDRVIEITNEKRAELKTLENEKRKLIAKIKKSSTEERKVLRIEEGKLKDKINLLIVGIEDEIIKFGVGNLAFVKYLYI